MAAVSGGLLAGRGNGPVQAMSGICLCFIVTLPTVQQTVVSQASEQRP